MSELPPIDPKRISDDEFARLLTRAVELDARMAGGLSLDEVRAAATEAGINPVAISAALLEMGDAGTRVVVKRWAFKSVLAGIAVGVGVGVVLSLPRLLGISGDTAIFTVMGLALLPPSVIAR